jgi:hypothetical protein
MTLMISGSWNIVHYVRESVELTGLKVVPDSVEQMLVSELQPYAFTGEKSLQLAVLTVFAISSLRDVTSIVFIARIMK